MASLFNKFYDALGVMLGSVAPAAAREWSLVSVRNEATGHIIIFRVVKTFVGGFIKADQPVRVILEWAYKGNNGQPVGLEAGSMNAFEDAIDPALAQEGFATLALVSTGEDMRKWTYYAKSEAEFHLRMKRALGTGPAYPVQVQVSADPGWTRYQEIRSKIS
jgi:hypothetical protein